MKTAFNQHKRTIKLLVSQRIKPICSWAQ